MADARTVRARIGSDLAAQVDAAMEREERTESDIVRRALRTYLSGHAPNADYLAAALAAVSGVDSKTFRGPDPRKK